MLILIPLAKMDYGYNTTARLQLQMHQINEKSFLVHDSIYDSAFERETE